jgi:hypothetical protein
MATDDKFGSELHSIMTEGRKEVPDGTVVTVGLGSLPGTVTIRLTLPGQAGESVYPDLEIREGVVTLPVKLAFLCHAKEDASFVEDLAVRLLQAGVLTWFDRKDLLPGDKWKTTIDDAIDRSDYALVFLSSTSVSKTGYFQRELRYILEQSQLRPQGARFIIPVLIDECAVPRDLRDIHWLRTKDPSWYETLQQALLAS